MYYVFNLIRVSKDVKKFQEIVRNNPEYYDHMPLDAYKLVSTYTRFGKVLKTEITKVEAKMCKAINDLIEMKLAEGKIAARAESVEQFEKYIA